MAVVLNLPFFRVALLLIEIDAYQDDLLATAPVLLSIIFVLM